ncbi:MAG TPA: YCF48-related protein [Moraxellaceae bacterium]|nr:YCF48-related protein [Moraxellaceae bacterium]
MKTPSRILIGLVLATSIAAPAALAGPARSVLDRPAVASAKAAHTLLLDVAQAGSRLVAVGDRGHIVYSDNQGGSWTQASVPVSVMLTAVHFASARQGWAVGHHGVILHTVDGGVHWTLQRADREANSEKAGAPLLGVWFADENTGYAVGAYGYFLVTHDGGATWTDNASAIANPDAWHLNAIRGRATGPVFIVGEHGKLFRSMDRGVTWSSLGSPFDGSYFGVSPLSDDLVLIYGLQGRLFASTDQGSSWHQVQTGVTSGINAAIRLENGKIVVAGNAGVVLVAADKQLDFVPDQRADRQSISALLPAGGDGLVTVGEGGAKFIKLGQK